MRNILPTLIMILFTSIVYADGNAPLVLEMSVGLSAKIVLPVGQVNTENQENFSMHFTGTCSKKSTEVTISIHQQFLLRSSCVNGKWALNEALNLASLTEGLNTIYVSEDKGSEVIIFDDALVKDTVQ